MTLVHTSVKHTAARGALVVGASWLGSAANTLFAPPVKGVMFSGAIFNGA